MSLYCAVCKAYKNSLQSLKSFSRAWKTGSTNQKVSNHTTSKVYKVAMTQNRADAVKASSRSAVHAVFHNRAMFVNIGTRTQAWMEKKFDLCFMMAKKSILFPKYSHFLSRSSDHKYLGVTLSSNLSWSVHMSNTCNQ